MYFFSPICPQIWPFWSLIDRDIFDNFSYAITERNLTDFMGSKYCTQRPLPNLCFSDRSVNKDDHHSLWLARAFSISPLQPLNGIWRNFTGSKYSTSSPLPRFVSDRYFNRDGRSGLWLAETCLTSTLQSLNGLRRNSQGFKYTTSFTMFVFSGRFVLKDGRPDIWLTETFSYFSSAFVEWVLTKLYSKTVFNILFQVCGVFHRRFVHIGGSPGN